MSNKPYKGFRPNWLENPAPEGSYRSISRWGNSQFSSSPRKFLYHLMKESFQTTDDDFRAYTRGHFPRSFENSGVGGWVVT